MKPIITMQIDPHELYGETDVFMGLKALETAVNGILKGLEPCIIRDEDGKPASEIELVLSKMSTDLDLIIRRILLGNLTVIRK